MVYVDDRIWEFDLEAGLTEISEQRREQALRYRHELGRRQCVLAYLLLKRALREEFGITENPVFAFGEHGKPTLVGHPDIHFNLSHCREAVACVVGSRPVGIDIESVRPLKESLVRYTMNDLEISLIESDPSPDVTFIRLWTMKEATLKLSGRGISNDMKEVVDTDKLDYISVELPHYVYTVCQQKKKKCLKKI